MTVVIPPGYCNVAVNGLYTVNAHPIINTFGLDVPAFSTEGGIADAVFDAWNDAFGAFISVDQRVESVRVYTESLEDISSQAPADGLSVGQMASPNTAFLLKKTGNIRGRANRGRMYLYGPNDDQVDGAGQIASGTLSALQDACDEFLVALSEIEGVTRMVVLHSSEADEPAPVLKLTADAFAATQRRRMR